MFLSVDKDLSRRSTYMTKKLVRSFLFVSLITVLLCGYEGMVKSKAGEIITGAGSTGNIYRISEFLDETQYDEYMNDSGHLFAKLQAFRQRLADSPEFRFYACADNFIETIDREIPETCMVNHGTEYAAESGYELDGEHITATEAIQVSENFFTLFPLKICEGRSFEPSDFNYGNDETIPVIMGNAYRSSFCLGDTFEAYYILERRSFTVIGFTDSGSDFYLSSSSRMVPYENFIIMPFENISEDSFSARAILLQQICGLIATHDGRGSALDTIGEYLTECGLENWSGMIIVPEQDLIDRIQR